MKESATATVNVYDSSPLNQVYELLIRFDSFANRDWTIPETKYAAQVWAEKFLALDGSLFPGWLDRLRYEVFVDLSDQVLPKSSGYYVDAGISVYVDEAPTGSRLLNQFQMGLKIQALRKELAAQIPALRS